MNATSKPSASKSLKRRRSTAPADSLLSSLPSAPSTALQTSSRDPLSALPPSSYNNEPHHTNATTNNDLLQLVGKKDPKRLRVDPLALRFENGPDDQLGEKKTFEDTDTLTHDPLTLTSSPLAFPHLALIDNLLVERSDVISEIFSYVISAASPSTTISQPRHCRDSDSTSGAVCSVFLVSKLWLRAASDVSMWSGIFVALSHNVLLRRPSPMLSELAKFNQEEERKSKRKLEERLGGLLDLTPSKLSNGSSGPSTRQCSQHLGVTSLVPFVNLGQKHVGSEGVLYKVRERSTMKVYAMKKTKGKNLTSLVKESLTNNLTTLHYPALREVVVLKSLAVRGCVNVSGLRGVRLIDGDLYRWYDYVDGTMADDLSGARAQNKPYPYAPEVAKSLFKQLLNGLSALHQHGIIHRNLKPKHLLLDYKSGGEVTLKISDFALTRVNTEPKMDFTPDQVTIWYRPPEILMGDKQYTTSVDIWSAGCIFAEMFLGAALFRDKSEIGLLFKIFKAVGTPNAATWTSFTTLPNMLQFPDFKRNVIRQIFTGAVEWHGLLKPCSLSDHLVESRGFDLLEKLLVPNPGERMTADAALESAYFVPDGGEETPLQHQMMRKQDDFYQTLRKTEEELAKSPVVDEAGTVDRAKIKPNHRAILVDWLVEIVDVFDMSPRTTFLAMTFVDAYLLKNLAISTDKLQLFGATCLHIASKIEDGVRYISTKDLTFCGDNTYKINDIVDMERTILTALDFEISLPTVFDFAFSQLTNMEFSWGTDDKLKYTVGYLCEIALQGTSHLAHSGSVMAASIMALALVMERRNCFPDELKKLVKLEFHELKECMASIWGEALGLQFNHDLKVIIKRYSREEKLFVGGVRLANIMWNYDDLRTRVEEEAEAL